MLKVRVLNTKAQLDGVYRLTHDAYVERGYSEPQASGRLIHYQRLDEIPETTILVAVTDGQIVGTNSLTLDGPCGLHVDHDFRSECDAIRAEGRRLAASWRIATILSCRSQPEIVKKLIKETLAQLVELGVETCLFTFNPRHERFYKRLLNMRTVARRTQTKGLKNAPAVFMRLDMECCPDYWLGTPELRRKKYQGRNPDLEMKPVVYQDRVALGSRCETSMV